MDKPEKPFLSYHLEVNLIIAGMICILLGLIYGGAYLRSMRTAPAESDTPSAVSEEALPLPPEEISTPQSHEDRPSVLSVVEKESGSESVELATILSNARVSIARIRSGRIVYTKVMERTPDRFSEEKIEEITRKYEERLRKEMPLLSEEKIRYSTRQKREAWEAINEGGMRKASFSGEYIFDGENSYHMYVLYANNPASREVHERYIFENEVTTIVTRRNPITKRHETSATIETGVTGGPGDFRSPMHLFTELMPSYLSSDKWKRYEVLDNGRDVIYTIHARQSGIEYHIDILPEKHYCVKEIRMRNDPVAGTQWRRIFDKMRWDPYLRAYHPTEIVSERWHEEGPAPAWLKDTYIFEEVEFNKDYDAEMFRPVFQEGISIWDRRFDPPKTYNYKGPETLDEYEELLDRSASNPNGEQPK